MSMLQHLALRHPGANRAPDAIAASSPSETIPGQATLTKSDARARESRLRAMVDDHAPFVARVLRNAGIAHADVDDEVQRTFIVAAKRLNDVRPGAERSFLVQTALHMAAHARRTVARRREVRDDQAPEVVDASATPEQLTDQRRARRILDNLLDQMEANLRAVFVLYEFEEMSMAEIADALSIPPGTVASRLRRARADFRARTRLLERGSNTEGEKP